MTAPAPRAYASGQGRIHQAGRDQYISETHIHAPAAPLGPDTVRVPPVERMAGSFRDRTPIRAALHAAVGAGGEIHLLHGLGGCGKTTLALLAFDLAAAAGQTGLWVDASNPTALRAGMLAVAADRGASPTELEAARTGSRAPADLAWECLHRSADRWLLVLDGADEPGPLVTGGWLRRSARGTVVVTSRLGTSPAWHEAVRHRLDVLGPADAAAVLLELAPDAGSPEEARLLAARLGHLPLALRLAGAYLDGQILEPLTMSDYLRRLDDDDPGELLDRGAENPGPDGRGTLRGTWELSADALVGAGAPEAVTLMRLLSCWAAGPLPLRVLVPARLDAAGLGGFDPALPGTLLDKALRALRSRTLVQITGGGDTGGERSVSAHALMLDTVHGRIAAEPRGRLLAAAARLLGEAADGTEAGDVPLVPHALALLARAGRSGGGAPAAALAPVRRLRDGARERGAVPTALELARAAADAQQTPGAGDRHALAAALADAGRYAEAEELLQPLAAESARQRGARHPDTLAVLNTRGRALYNLGRFAEDEECQRQVAAGRAEQLGDGHPDTLEARCNLAEALGPQGRWAEAEALARDTSATAAAQLGEDHPATIAARLTLGWALDGLGRPADAEPELRAAAEASTRLRGPDHPRTLTVRNMLLNALKSAGRDAEAAELAAAVLAARNAALGPEHLHSLSVATDLAELLARTGRRDEAAELARTTLDALERTLGPVHRKTTACRAVLHDIERTPRRNA